MASKPLLLMIILFSSTAGAQVVLPGFDIDDPQVFDNKTEICEAIKLLDVENFKMWLDTLQFPSEEIDQMKQRAEGRMHGIKTIKDMPGKCRVTPGLADGGGLGRTIPEEKKPDGCIEPLCNIKSVFSPEIGRLNEITQIDSDHSSAGDLASRINLLITLMHEGYRLIQDICSTEWVDPPAVGVPTLPYINYTDEQLIERKHTRENLRDIYNDDALLATYMRTQIPVGSSAHATLASITRSSRAKARESEEDLEKIMEEVLFRGLCQP